MAAAEAPLVEEAVGPNAVMDAGVKRYISSVLILRYTAI
jgi:hypothetical protein